MALLALYWKAGRTEKPTAPVNRGFRVARFMNMDGACDGAHWRQSIQVINCSPHSIRVEWVETTAADFDLVESNSDGVCGTRTNLGIDVPVNERKTFAVTLAYGHEDWQAGGVDLEFWVEERVNEVSSWTSYPMKIVVPDAQQRTP